MSDLVAPPQSRELSVTQQRKTGRYPCDGIPRYRVKGVRPSGASASGPLLSYGDAYAATMKASGAKQNDRGGWSITRESVRRVGRLNEAYWAVAKPYILAKAYEAMLEKARLASEAKKAATAPTTPSEDLKPSLTPNP